MATGPLSRPLRFLPIRRVDQLVFAEACSQALMADLAVVEAVDLAGAVNPSHRFRRALTEMTRHCRGGYPLDAGLLRTRASVSAGLLAALRVGEEQGCLAVELRAFARRLDPRADARLARSLGRSAGVRRFASCLARLLGDRRLSPALIESAGRVASGAQPSLGPILARIADAVENGSSFWDALEREPRTFDPLFRRFVREATGRDQLRAILSRLGDKPDS